MDFSNLPLDLLAIPAAVIGLLALILLLRPLFCWYFKINQRIAILSRIEEHLAAMAQLPQAAAASEPAEAEQAPAKEEQERDPYLKNLSGEELEEGLKGLVLRADERIY